MEKTENKNSAKNPWFWVPTLYLYQGMPYIIAMLTSVVMYKSLGIKGSTITFWTSLIYLPWAIKFIWGPFVDITSTKRNWIVASQLILGISFIVLAFVIQLPVFFMISIVVLFAIAISSAGHDIATDGYYMLALDQHNQTFFVGIRSTFYRIAKLIAMGLIPIFVGYIEGRTGLEPVKLEVEAVAQVSENQWNADSANLSALEGDLRIVFHPDRVQIPFYSEESLCDSAISYITLSAPPPNDEVIVTRLKLSQGSKDIKLVSGSRVEFTSQNWNQPKEIVFKIDPNLKVPISSTYIATSGNTRFAWTISLIGLGIFLIGLAIYHKVILPRPEDSLSIERVKTGFKVFIEVWVSFFTKPGMVPALIFFLIYRLGEGQLVKVVPLFFLDSIEQGGLGLTTGQYGIAYGITAPVFMTIGGILGGIIAAKFGLKRMVLPMAIIMNAPMAVYLYLSIVQPQGMNWSLFVSIALEEFGYGFGFTGYMLYMLQYVGESKYKTAEFALATSLMALGMMIPGMISGKIQELIGYQNFFIFVLICAIPGIIIIKFLNIDPRFGLKKE